VLIADSETIVMKPLATYYNEVMFTSQMEELVESAEERRLILTDQARKDFTEEERALMGSPSRIVPSSSRSNSTALWVYDVSL